MLRHPFSFLRHCVILDILNIVYSILDSILCVNAPLTAWLQKAGNDQHVPRFSRAPLPWRHQRTAAAPGGGFGYRFSISTYSHASAWTRWPAWYALSRTGTLVSNVFSSPPLGVKCFLSLCTSRYYLCDPEGNPFKSLWWIFEACFLFFSPLSLW